MRHLRKQDLTERLRAIGQAVAILTLGCSEPGGPTNPTFEFTTDVVFGVRTVEPALSVVRRQVLVSGVLSRPIPVSRSKVPSPPRPRTGW